MKLSLYATLVTAIMFFSITGSTGGEFSGGGIITQASFNESAGDSESQKQKKAESLFKVLTTTEAIASNRFYKSFPTFHFKEAKIRSLMHDDCFKNGLLYGGVYRKCIDWSDKVNDCLETELANMTVPQEEAPQTIKVVFYRKVSGVSSHEQTSGKYRVGSREYEIPQCK